MSDTDGIALRVQLNVPDAPPNLISTFIGDTVKDFMKRTNICRVEREIVPVDGQANYSIGDSAYTPLKILRANDGIHPIFGMTLEADGTVTFDLDTIDAVHHARRVIRIFFSVIYKPNELPDWLTANYEEAIVAGTTARLMKLPGRTFTDFNGAELFHRTYRDGITTALNRIACNGTTDNGGLSA